MLRNFAARTVTDRPPVKPWKRIPWRHDITITRGDTLLFMIALLVFAAILQVLIGLHLESPGFLYYMITAPELLLHYISWEILTIMLVTLVPFFAYVERRYLTKPLPKQKGKKTEEEKLAGPYIEEFKKDG